MDSSAPDGGPASGRFVNRQEDILPWEEELEDLACHDHRR